MTIAIGIKSQEGIVLCADSQYTSASKTQGQKVFPWHGGRVGVAFALAGDVANATMAIQDCKYLLTESAKDSLDFIKCKSLLKETIRNAQEIYVDRKPIEEREAAQFELIIGVVAHDESEPHMFYTSKGAMVEFDGFQTQGTGAYLSDYLLARSYRETLTFDQTILLCAYVVSITKKHDAFCGGESQFITIRNGVMSAVVPYDLRLLDGFLGQYERIVGKLLFTVGDFNKSDEEFKKDMEQLRTASQVIRTSVKVSGSNSQELIRKLREDVTESGGIKEEVVAKVTPVKSKESQS